MAERVFRLFSLAFLSIGFVVGVAGADKDGAKDLFVATGDLIDHVSIAREANAINSYRAPIQKVGLEILPSRPGEVTAQAQKEAPTSPENLPTTAN